MQTAHTRPWRLVFVSKTEILSHAFSFPSGGFRHLQFSDWSDRVSTFTVSLVCVVPAQRRVWFQARFWCVTPHCHTLCEPKPFGSQRRAHTDTHPHSVTVLTPFDYISRWWHYLQTRVVAWQVKKATSSVRGKHIGRWRRWDLRPHTLPALGPQGHASNQRKGTDFMGQLWTFEGERIRAHQRDPLSLGLCPFRGGCWRKDIDAKNQSPF